MLAIQAAQPVDPNPCHHPALHLRCPDWAISKPTDLHLRSVGRRVLLQMTNSLVNVGAGPVEFKGRRFSEYDMYARQVIRRTGGRPAMTYRTGARLHYTYVDYGRGAYWKFAHAARFELWRLDGSGRRAERVRVGPKLDYCNRDLVRRRPDLPGSPAQAVFPACSQQEDIAEVTLGTSVGWVDRYPYTYPSNWIEVTGQRGCFAILMRVDPHETVWESDEANNTSSKVVRLPFRHGPQDCPRYDPTPPAEEPVAPSSRSSARSTFPDAVLGSSAAKSTRLGYL